ncbi:MAG: tail fiber domain-containing protein [Candidatus Pacebacteria bacterium]|nr:tail fiber domain-containing protein [Candidatus Paceibacterota bacterium]
MVHRNRGVKFGNGTQGEVAKITNIGDFNIQGKNALRGNDSYLRLNQDGQFTSGVYTPGVFRATGVINSDVAIQTNGTTRVDSSGNLSNIGTINSGAITSSGALNLGANTITSGLINGQTISSAANFTGTLTTASQVNAASNGGSGGYISSGNYGGTGSAAYFPSGLWANGSNSWIYGAVNFNGALSGASSFSSTGNITTSGGQFNGSGAGLTGTASSLSVGGSSASSPLLSALGNYVWSAATLPTGYNQGIQSSFVSSAQGFPNYGSVMTMNTYSGGGGALQLYTPYSPTYGGNGLKVRYGNYDVSSGNSWTSWKTLWDDSNDGASSGLDADLLDGLSSASFMSSGNNASYPVTAGDGNGLKFWNGSDTYKISMGNASEYHYGPVTDYSIKNTIDSNGNTRGFTWGQNGTTPVTALNVGTGDFQTQGKITAMGTTTINNDLIVTGQGNITYNPTPNSWTPKESTRQWWSVAMSSDGSKQTAVVSNGYIYVSTDYGNTWTPKESSRNWYGIAMSSDGSKQTAIAYSGQIYVSSDYGNTWIPKESNRYWLAVTMSSDGSRQTAAVNNGQIYVSSDYGNTWTPKDSNRVWWSIDMSSDGSKQTALVNGGQIYVSTDYGNTWTPKDSNRNWVSVAMSSDGSKQTALVNGGQIYVSTDYGNTWTPKDSNRSWISVDVSSYGNKQTAVVNGGQIYISVDSGNNWSAKGPGTSWDTVAISSDGLRQTAVAYPGNYIYTLNYEPTVVVPNAKVGINTSAPQKALQVVGDIRVGAASSYGCIENFSGASIAGTCSSDERLKTAIIDLPSLLNKIKDMRIVNYKWNDIANSVYSNDTTVENTGYLAQNIEALFPEMVVTDKNGYKQVNYTGLGIYAVKGIQELAQKEASSTPILESLVTMQASTTESLSQSIASYITLASSTQSLDIRLLAIESSQVSKLSITSEGKLGIGFTAGEHPLVMLHTKDTEATSTVARFENKEGYCDIDPTTHGIVCTTNDTQRTNQYLIDTTSTVSTTTQLLTTASTSSTTLEKLTALRVVTYTLQENESAGSYAGLILSDIQTLFPDLVRVDIVGKASFSMSSFIPYIIESIKSLAMKVDDLKNKLITGEVTAKTICLGETCIDEAKLKILLQQQTLSIPDGIPSQVLGDSTSTEGVLDVATSTENNSIDISTSTESTTSVSTSTEDIIIPEGGNTTSVASTTSEDNISVDLLTTPVDNTVTEEVDTASTTP